MSEVKIFKEDVIFSRAVKDSENIIIAHTDKRVYKNNKSLKVGNMKNVICIFQFEGKDSVRELKECLEEILNE